MVFSWVVFVWHQGFDSTTLVRELNGLPPIVELLKSEYAVIQSLALNALQLATEDGLSAFFIFSIENKQKRCL